MAKPASRPRRAEGAAKEKHREDGILTSQKALLTWMIEDEKLFGKISRNFAFKLVSVVLGAIIYWVVYQVVITAGLNANDMKLISALVVAVFLAVPYLKGKYFSKPVKKGGASHA